MYPPQRQPEQAPAQPKVSNRVDRLSKDTLPILKPDEVKVSRPVLRGLGAGNSPWLPGISPVMFNYTGPNFASRAILSEYSV
jgi:hypothetical protein